MTTMRADAEKTFVVLFCCAVFLLDCTERANGLPSPESRMSPSSSAISALQQRLGKLDDPSSSSAGGPDVRQKGLLHQAKSHVGRRPGEPGDAALPSSEDEFIEHLEKLLRTGGFREEQRVHQKSLAPAPVQPPKIIEAIQQQKVAAFSDTPPAPNPNLIHKASEQDPERPQQPLIGNPGELSQRWAHHPANEPSSSGHQEQQQLLASMKQFAFRPDEKEYWQVKPSHQVASPEALVTQPHQRVHQQMHHLRELPISADAYKLLYPETHLSDTNNYNNNNPAYEQNIDAIDPLQHLHRLASLTASVAGHGLPQSLRADDFLDKPSGKLPATFKDENQQVSRATGQKEVVTYIDIPKMITVEDLAAASAAHMKKEDDVNGRSPAAGAFTAAAGAGNLSGDHQGASVGVEKGDKSNIKDENKERKPNGKGEAGVGLDVGDSKTHWLQSEPENKMAAAEKKQGEGPGRGQEDTPKGPHVIDGWQVGLNDGAEDEKDDELPQGPRALKLSHPGNGKDGKADPMSKVYFIGAIAGCSAAVAFGVAAAGIFWHRLKKNAKAAEETEYPAYGITGPGKHGGSHDVSPTSGDRKLAHSAQMYHYQHQKQQMIAMENHERISRRHGSTSDAEESDEEENEEGDYTVYECPGLAPTGEMEVRNPLFQDDLLTPASPHPEMAEDDDDPVQP